VTDSLVLLPIFAGNTLIVFSISVWGYATVRWGLEVFPERVPILEAVSTYAVASIPEVLPAAILAGLVLTLLRYLARPGIKILSLFLLLTASAGALCLSAFWVPPLIRTPERIPEAEVRVDEGYITPGKSSALYAARQEGASLERVLVMNADTVPALSFQSAETVVRDESGTLVLASGRPHSTLPVGSAETVFTPPAFLHSLYRDTASLTRILQDVAGSPLPQKLAAAAAAAYVLIAGCLAFSISRWPLYNAVFIVLYLRGFLALYPLLHGPEFIQVASMFVPERYLGWAPSALMAAAGTVFLFAAWLFSSGGRRAGREFA
jgi:hypothetical protein